jgi:hypothetical protein
METLAIESDDMSETIYQAAGINPDAQSIGGTVTYLVGRQASIAQAENLTKSIKQEAQPYFAKH